MMNLLPFLKTRLGKVAGGLTVAGVMACAAYAASCNLPPECQAFYDDHGVCQYVVCEFREVTLHHCSEFGCS